MHKHFIKKVLSILVLIALYVICGFSVLLEQDEIAFLAWCAFTGTAALQVFILTTRLIIILMELPGDLHVEYIS